MNPGSRSSTITPSTQMQMAGMSLGKGSSGMTQSRSPSPPTIPPPPLKAPMSAPPKLKAPIATRVMQEDAGPLRESRRLNVVKEDVAEGRDDVDPKGTYSEERQGAEDDRSEAEVGPKKKKAPSVHDASLLLGLRTSSTTSSPATVPDEEEEKPSPPSTTYEPSDHSPLVPKDYPKSLALPGDSAKLNSLHCFIRTNLIEIFVVEKSKTKSPTHSPGAMVGRVGLRCVHCAEARKRGTWDDRAEAPMAMFYPKSVSEIYRLVTSWQRCHLRKCRHMPPAVRAEWDKRREIDKTRGKTPYWVTSAREIGLIDCTSRAGGVRFAIQEQQQPGASKNSNE